MLNLVVTRALIYHGTCRQYNDTSYFNIYLIEFSLCKWPPADSLWVFFLSGVDKIQYLLCKRRLSKEKYKFHGSFTQNKLHDFYNMLHLASIVMSSLRSIYHNKWSLAKLFFRVSAYIKQMKNIHFTHRCERLLEERTLKCFACYLLWF